MGSNHTYSIDDQFKVLDDMFESMPGTRSEKIREAIMFYLAVYNKCTTPHVGDNADTWSNFFRQLNKRDKDKFSDDLDVVESEFRRCI